jgi:two-component system cell cycle sensor histidine kinase/response regulator CckA
MELSRVYTVLVVHDLSSRLDQLHRILQRAGYDVLKATNSDAACKLAATQQPDLILIEETSTAAASDLVSRLRKINDIKITPIVLTTAAASLPLAAGTETQNCNPTYSLQNPYDDLHLVSTVARLIATNAAARQVNKSERRYRELFEFAHDILYTTDLKGRYTSINKRGLEILGYTTHEAMALSMSAVATPEDVALSQEMLLLKLQRGTSEPTIYEIEIRAKDGTWLPVEIISQLIFEDGKPVGVQGIARDISKRKRDAAALEDANNRSIKEYQHLLRRISALAEIVGTARDISTIFDGLVQFAHVSLPCSTMALALYELDHNQVLPQFVWTPEGTNDIRTSKPLVLNGGTPGQVVLSKKIIISDESSQRFQSLDPARETVAPKTTIMTIPMMATERVVGLLELHAETDRTQFTDEHKTAISMAANIAAHGVESLRLLARDRDRENHLRQAQKMEALGTLAGGVAHDFNNILTAMFCYCDMAIVKIGNTNPAAVELIESANRVGKRSQLFIEQLLGFCRKQVLKPRALDLNKAISDFHHVIKRLVPETITVTYALDDRIPSVYLDPLQINQIILNLAINARDAMPKSGNITISTRFVLPRQPGHKPGATKSPHLPQVIMEFSDTGHGIESETQKKIFEPFFTTKGVEGTGLGLSMVYGTVKQAGGAITCASQLNKGTTFTIRLPASEASATIDTEELQTVPARRNSARTILLAEDDKMVQHTVSMALRSAGYDVCTADNGQQALEIFERDADYIHLLVTDLLMPGLNGTDLSTHVRKLRRDLPILYISGYPTDSITADGHLPEDICFMQKPFNRLELLRKVDGILHGEAVK